MSYDIYLDDEEGTPIHFDKRHHIGGGTQALGGTSEAWLNVTYNYSDYFYRHLDKKLGIRWLYGKKARDTEERLTSAIDALNDDTDPDYWKATEGNAREALIGLRTLGRMAPDATWSGD